MTNDLPLPQPPRTPTASGGVTSRSRSMSARAYTSSRMPRRSGPTGRSLARAWVRYPAHAACTASSWSSSVTRKTTSSNADSTPPLAATLVADTTASDAAPPRSAAAPAPSKGMPRRRTWRRCASNVEAKAASYTPDSVASPSRAGSSPGSRDGRQDQPPQPVSGPVGISSDDRSDRDPPRLLGALGANMLRGVPVELGHQAAAEVPGLAGRVP